MAEEDSAVEMSAMDHATGDTVTDHLANKRTMLAWSRTGIAIIALGFVVSRFGLLLRALQVVASNPLPEGTSTLIGAVLVLIGGFLIILASLDYVRTGRAIERGVYRWSPNLEVALSILLVLAAAVLTAYLVLTA